LNDPDYITVAGDAGKPEVARKVVETALERFGRVDTLINNAGIRRPGPIETHRGSALSQRYGD
jgi:NAD(P)-dependent dehydrogenase (short-subunit alcohol dehydrogenase family)